MFLNPTKSPILRLYEDKSAKGSRQRWRGPFSAYQYNRCLAIPSGLISETKTDSRLYYGQSTTHWKPHQRRACPTAAEHRLARAADGLLAAKPLPTARTRLSRHRPTAKNQPLAPPRLLPLLLRIHLQPVLICKDTNFS